MLTPGYPVRTERLDLRPFAQDDFEELYAFHVREDVCRYLYWEPRTREQFQDALDRKVAQTAIEYGGDSLNLVVTVRETGTIVGDVLLHWLSEEHGTGEVGFIFDPAHHGQGYATEATRALLALGFDDLRLWRIIGRCDARNAASARLMERLGMRREAHFVENELVKGERTDELVYALLASEYRPKGIPST